MSHATSTHTLQSSVDVVCGSVVAARREHSKGVFKLIRAAGGPKKRHTQAPPTPSDLHVNMTYEYELPGEQSVIIRDLRSPATAAWSVFSRLPDVCPCSSLSNKWSCLVDFYHHSFFHTVHTATGRLPSAPPPSGALQFFPPKSGRPAEPSTRRECCPRSFQCCCSHYYVLRAWWPSPSRLSGQSSCSPQRTRTTRICESWSRV